MLKRIMSRAVPEHEWPIWWIPLTVSLAFVLASIAAYWHYFGPGIGRFNATAYRPAQSSAPVRLEVGGTLFAIPMHYTRNSHSRQADVLEHVELHAILPSLTPYDETNAEQFLRTDMGSPLVLINIRAVQQEMPEKQVFKAIYAPYIRGGGVVRDDGLQGYQFNGNSPYSDKEIFRALPTGSAERRQAPPIFICDRSDLTAPTCESRFALGETARVSYRFKRVHLKEWETIDASIRELIRNFRAAARTIG